MSIKNDKLKLESMSEGATEYVNWFEESGGVVVLRDGLWFLYGVPMYGGSGIFERAYTHDELDELLDLAYSWT